MAPVKWIDGWPVITAGDEEVRYSYRYSPIVAKSGANTRKYSGNFIFRDDFISPTLDINWMFLRTPKEQWYDLKQKKGFISLKLRPESCDGNMNPSFLGHRQQHVSNAASAALSFMPGSENEKSGLLVFQNERHFYFLCKSKRGADSVVQLFKSTDGKTVDDSLELIASQKIPTQQDKKVLFLKIESNKDKYFFSYSFSSGQWTSLQDNLDGTFLSTKTAGGFVGSIYAMYATSLGKPSGNTAAFDWFEYEGKDAFDK